MPATAKTTRATQGAPAPSSPNVGAVASILVITLVTALLCFEVNPTRALRLGLFDGYQRFAPRVRSSQPAVVVAVDEASLRAFGQWPWPRTLTAELLSRVHEARPAAVGLDMFYPEVDRLSASEWVNSARGVPDDVRRKLSSLPSNDEALGKAIAGGKTVLGISAAASPDIRFGRLTDSISIAASSPEPSLPSFAGYIGSIDAIQDKARRVGLLNASFDSADDGVDRRLPLAARVQGHRVGLLAVETLSAATDAPVSIESASFGRLGFHIGSLSTVAEGDGSKWMRWGRFDHERYVSAAQILSGRFDPAQLRDKVVLIGVSGLGLQDYRRTPLGEFVPGPEVHMQVVEQLVDGTLLSRGTYARWLELLCALAVACGLIVFAKKTSAMHAGAALAAVILASFGLGYAGFLNGALIDVANPIALWIVVYGIILTTSLIAARRAREKVIYMFSRFVNPHVVKELLKDESFAQAAQARDITVLFSDVRNFTTLSEKRSPAEVVFLLNGYFERQVEVVFSHRGAIDKFIGDAIMAFWGAPLDEPMHARLAVACALDLLDNVEQFRKDMGIDAGTFDIGIGIHTGRAVVGLIGSDQRREYTAMGNTVNLANRIESLTKETGYKLLVSAETRAYCGDEFEFQSAGTHTVKGIEKPVEVFVPRRRNSAVIPAREDAVSTT